MRLLLIKEDDVERGECTFQLLCNEDSDNGVEPVENKTYKTGRKHVVTVSVVTLRSAIDPDDADALDDRYTLFSNDDDATYRKTLAVGEDCEIKSNFINLVYPSIKPGLSYTLEVNPGSGEEAYNQFEDVILE